MSTPTIELPSFITASDLVGLPANKATEQALKKELKLQQLASQQAELDLSLYRFNVELFNIQQDESSRVEYFTLLTQRATLERQKKTLAARLELCKESVDGSLPGEENMMNGCCPPICTPMTMKSCSPYKGMNFC